MKLIKQKIAFTWRPKGGITNTVNEKTSYLVNRYNVIGTILFEQAS